MLSDHLKGQAVFQMNGWMHGCMLDQRFLILVPQIMELTAEVCESRSD